MAAFFYDGLLSFPELHSNYVFVTIKIEMILSLIIHL